jgi:site-specific DNA recombinase
MAFVRAAIYARYSSDLQRDTSLEDQVAVARRYAEQHEWDVLQAHIYTDAATSGASIDGRQGLQALLAAAERVPQSFDVVLVDDSSRIARDLADALRTMQTLKFRGVRVIYISQGIDSASDQADALVTMHGLVDQLYLKEMAKKIRRGLAGQLERGYVTGSKTYAYRTVGVSSGKTDVNGHPELLGKRRVICEEEAKVVSQIFQWTANGIGVFTIIQRLKASVSGPFGRTWTQGTIRRILRNEVYTGKLLWGRVTYERQPGTNKMVRREQPRSEWKVFDAPDLRIISDELWEKVQERQRSIRAALKGNLARGRLSDFQSRYLMSGFLRCGTCGGACAIVSGGKAAGPRYGCIRAYRQYACANRVPVKPSILEQRLLEKLQAELLKPDIIEYIVSEVKRRAADDTSKTKRRDSLERELERERRKLQNLIGALEEGQPSQTVLGAIRNRERGIKRLEAELGAIRSAPALNIEPARIRQELSHLSELLRGAAEIARPVFRTLKFQVRLFPIERPGERPFLRAVATATLGSLAGDVSLAPAPKTPRGPSSGGGGRVLAVVRRSLGKAAAARKSSQEPSTTQASAATVRSARSTARRCLTTSLKPSCSATPAAPSRAP